MWKFGIIRKKIFQVYYVENLSLKLCFIVDLTFAMVLPTLYVTKNLLKNYKKSTIKINATLMSESFVFKYIFKFKLYWQV